MSKVTRLVMAFILLCGVALLIYANVGFWDWLVAILQNGNLVMLLICVPMVSMPFYYEDYQGELKNLVKTRMRNVLSFLILVTISAHLLGAMLSVGAVLVIYPLMRPFAELYNADDLYLKTVSRAYMSSGFWSPAWATVIIYSAFPDVQWIRIIPVAIVFTLIYNCMNLLEMRYHAKHCPGSFLQADTNPGLQVDKKKILAMLLLAVIMITSIIIFNTVSGWDLLLVVSIVSLVFPLAVAIIRRHGGEYKKLMKNYYDVSLKNVQQQVALFVLAGFLGKGLDISGVGLALASLLPDWLRHTPPAMIAAILIIMTIPTLVGVHPTATGTAMVAVLQPAALGLANYTFCLTLISGWLIAMLVAPFCAASLMLSSANGKSGFANSTAINWKFTLLCIVVFSLLISVVGPMM